MKTQTKIISILIVSIVLIPQMVLASWWNPFSWSRESKQTMDIIEPSLVPPADKSISIPETTPKQITEPKIIEKIIEKPIIKTITVQDPALQAKIEALILENNTLKAEITRLRKANESLSSNSTSTTESKVISEFATLCISAKKDVLDLNKQIETLDDKYAEIQKEALTKNPDSGYLNSADYKQSLTTKQIAEKALIKQSINIAVSEMDLYCD